MSYISIRYYFPSTLKNSKHRYQSSVTTSTIYINKDKLIYAWGTSESEIELQNINSITIDGVEKKYENGVLVK